MRVDVHTHVWPDRTAKAVLQSMSAGFGFEAIAANTVDGIKTHMPAAGVGRSVVFGLVDRPDQVTRANDWLISLQDEVLVLFGALHPNWETKPKKCAAYGRTGSRASSRIPC